MRSSRDSSNVTGSTVQDLRQGALRALKLAAIALGVGLVMSTGAARAGDDDDEDDMTFEERLIDNLMTGIGAKGQYSKPGIDYRERSPLVVPPKLDLPPPAAETNAAPNWPKDPDEKRRKQAAAERKKTGNRAKELYEAARPLSPSEMNAARTAAPARENNDPIQPGVSNNPSMSPAQLGYTGGLWNMFKGNSGEEKKFTSEPPRESLTEPPPGYQTPSPGYAYGTGPDKSRNTYYDIMSGKEKTQ